MTAKIFTEQLDLSEASLSLASRKLENVILIKSGMSLNKRFYSEKVLEEAAPLFEGVKAYDGHEWMARKVSEITGWYANVQYRDGALHADRYFSNTESGRNILGVVEDIISGNAPKNLAGLSINAMGEGVLKNEDDPETMYFEVTALTAAESVDDVTQPAAGGAYLAAGQEMGEMAQAFLQSLDFEAWQQARPDLIERLKNEWKTARQSEAIKAKDAEIATLKAALDSAQAAINEHRSALVAAEANLASVRRTALLDEMLARVKLSDDWKTEIREQLLAVEPIEWAKVIEREQRKAESVKAVTRPRVEGAAQQVGSTPVPAPAPQPAPRPDEDVTAWMRRMSAAAT